MSTDSINGVVGQAAHFAGDYLFDNVALPNNTTLHSEEHTLNNTLGRLKLTGTLDQNLTMVAGNTLTITLQYKDGASWLADKTLVSLTGVNSIAAGEIFAIIPVPSDTRRIYRLQVATNFNASAVKLSAAVEALPLA